MFEAIDTIINLVSYVFFAIAVLSFLGSIFLCVMNLIKGDGWEKFRAILAAVLGVFIFTRLQSWIGSYVASMVFTSMAMCLIIGYTDTDTDTGKETYPGYTSPVTKSQSSSVKAPHEYNGTSYHYGKHTLYTNGNASHQYGNSEHFQNGDVGKRYW